MTTDQSRAEAFVNIAQIVAEGAPVTTGLITNGKVTGRFTMVAALHVDVVDGTPADSQYTVIGWEGNAPDSVVALQITAFGVFSLVSDHVSTTATQGGSVSLTPDAPGVDCTSLLSQAPPDLDAPTPVACQTETITASFVAPVGMSGDTIELPNQKVAGIRV